MTLLAIILSIVACGIAIAARKKINGIERRFAHFEAERTAYEATRGLSEPPLAGSSEISASPEPEIGAVAAPPPQTSGAIAPAEEPTVSPVPPEKRAASAIASSLAALEDQLMRRWLVWLGALALALGAVFLVKYSIERDFFGPVARVASGVLVGFASLAAGEWTRRHPPAVVVSVAVVPDYIPAGLSAAGIVALFASIYAAYGLYLLLPPLTAFVLLAAISGVAAVLSLAHGKFMALLGFVGGYVVPALVATPHPSAAGLLAYVCAVNAGALLLQRWHGWDGLGWAITAGAMVWGGFALPLADRDLALGLYLVATPALFVLLVPADRSLAERPAFVWMAAVVDGALMVALAIIGGYGATVITFASALVLLVGALGVYDQAYDRLAWIGGGIAVVFLAAWDFDRLLPAAPVSSYLLSEPPIFLRAYIALAIAAAAVAGIGSVIVMRRADRPARWAFLSAATPVALLIVSYWRIARLEESLPWATIALALAGANLAGAEYAARRVSGSDRNAALAAFSVCLVASISLGMTMSLRLGWLTVALSLQLPALVWLHERTQVRAVRTTALVLALIVLARLILNPSIADYTVGSRPIFNGLLYTYGVPWLAFLWATRGFRRTGDDTLVRVLESGTIALFAALVSLEIRHGLNGTLASRHYGLLEQGLQSDAWFAIAYGIVLRARIPEQPVQAAAWRLLAGVAALNLLLFSVSKTNPLFAAEPVGNVPIFDSLLFAYLVPAVFAALFVWPLRRLGLQMLAVGAGIAALALGFIYLSLETRHLFHGAVLLVGPTSDAEWYAYSAVWLIYGLALLLGGLLFNRQNLRLAGLAIGAIVAAKIFGFDMAALSGLYRAASFLGLGACLVGLGYLYQRIAVPRSDGASSSAV